MASKDDLYHTVEWALGEAGVRPIAWGDGRWRLALSNGSEIGAQARVADEWLELTVSPRFAPTTESWRTRALLDLNARLTGPVRIAVSGPGGARHLRADLCLAELDDLAERVALVCGDLRSATHVLQGDGQLMLTPLIDEDRERYADRFASLCMEAGWTLATKVAGEVALELTTDQGVYEARLESSPVGELRPSVRLFDTSAYSSGCLEAAAVLLLVVSARVRSIKGVIVMGKQVEVFGIAAASEMPTSAAAANRSLEALAVASCLVGRELQALQDEALAQEYLALWTGKPVMNLNGNWNQEEQRCQQQL
jgi:hypothetical protein